MKPERVPSRRNLNRKTPDVPWWLTRLREHPVKSLGTATLITGGLLVLQLFSHIGASPELDLSGAAATLLAIAIVGAVVNTIFACGALSVGWAMRSEDAKTSWMRRRDSLFVFAAPGSMGVCYAAVALYISASWVPSASLLIVMSATALVGAIYLLGRLENDELAGAVPAARWPATRFRLRIIALVLLLCVAWSLLALLAAAIFVVIFPSDMPADRQRILFPFGLAAWTLICYLGSIAVAQVKREQAARAAVGLAFCAMVALYGITQNWAATSLAVVRVLGVGQMPVALVLTREGCDTLNLAARGQRICLMAPGSSLGKACPVFLQSRIGSPFFVELSGFGDDGEWPARDPALRISAIPIAKSDVKSWPRIESLRASAPRAGASSPVIAYQDARAPALSKRQVDWVQRQCGTAP